MSHHTRSAARGKLQSANGEKPEKPAQTSKAIEAPSSSKLVTPKKEVPDKEEFLKALKLKNKQEVKSHEAQKKLQEIDKRKEMEIVKRNEMEIVKRKEMEIVKRKEMEIVKRNEMEIVKRKEMEIVKRKEMEIVKNQQNSLSASLPEEKFHTVLDDMGNLVGFNATK